MFNIFDPMSMKLQIAVVFLVVLVTGCQYENLDYTDILSKDLELKLESVADGMDHFMLPDHLDYDAIPQDRRHNPLNKEKIELGKFLFFETGLGLDASQSSGMETYSCASCHDPRVAFKPGSRQGIADGGFGYGTVGEMRTKNPSYSSTEIDAQGARPLSMLNVAFVENTFWNGQFGSGGVNEGTEHLWNEADATHLNELGFEAIETQNLEGIHLHRMEMSREIAEDLGYKSMFDDAFPDFAEDQRYSDTTLAFALSAYIRSLITDQAPFQQWLRGDRTAMSDKELKGALLFFGKARCFVCHNGPNLGSMEFHALGVKDMHEMGGFNTGASDKRNLGRGGFTGESEDMFAFKVPQLYNMGDNTQFFHGGSVASLEDLVDYKNNAQSENANVADDMLSDKFRPLNLTSTEKAHLIDFLRDGLRDTKVSDKYNPDFIMSGNCFPNNDERSKSELGCD